jgi:hypothetical protein
MFDKIGNLPLHPLVIHAAVVGIPLAVLLAFLFAFPKTRAWARWPMAIVVVGSTAVTFVARQSGLALETDLGIKPGNPVGTLIAKHYQLGNQLLYIMIVSLSSPCSTSSSSRAPRAPRPADLPSRRLFASSSRSCC